VLRRSFLLRLAPSVEWTNTGTSIGDFAEKVNVRTSTAPDLYQGLATSRQVQ
jgi:hypothetical protein